MKTLFVMALILNLLALEARSSTITREDLRKTVLHMQQLVKQQAKELSEAQRANHSLNLQLHSAQFQLSTTQQQITALTADVQKLQQWGEEANKQRQSAVTALDGATQHVRRLKWMICGALALLAAVVATRFSGLLQGPWALAMPPTAGALTFLGAWMVL